MLVISFFIYIIICIKNENWFLYENGMHAGRFLHREVQKPVLSDVWFNLRYAVISNRLTLLKHLLVLVCYCF